MDVPSNWTLNAGDGARQLVKGMLVRQRLRTEEGWKYKLYAVTKVGEGSVTLVPVQVGGHCARRSLSLSRSLLLLVCRSPARSTKLLVTNCGSLTFLVNRCTVARSRQMSVVGSDSFMRRFR